MRTGQGSRDGLQTLSRANPLLFGANAKFFGQKPAAQNEKSTYNST